MEVGSGKRREHVDRLDSKEPGRANGFGRVRSEAG